jgi:hypothetical protein
MKAVGTEYVLKTQLYGKVYFVTVHTEALHSAAMGKLSKGINFANTPHLRTLLWVKSEKKSAVGW